MLNWFVFILLVLTANMAMASDEAQTSEYLGYPYYDVQIYDPKKPETKNEMMMLHSGIASFEKRLDLIRRAKKSIELEYFIYELDKSGKLLAIDLINAAKRGVKVRILVDKSITIFQLNEYYGSELAKHGVDVRYYNEAKDPSTAQFRNHRKLLVMDGKEAITGGRNIGDDYFDLDEEYNFLDRDIWIKGPIVKTMLDSFDVYWISKRTRKLRIPEDRTYSRRLHRGSSIQRRRANAAAQKMHEKRLKAAKSFVKETEEIRKLRKKVRSMGEPILKNTSIIACPKTTYATDVPGASFIDRMGFIGNAFRKNYRGLRRVIFDKLMASKKKIFASSPYFMLNFYARNALSDLVKVQKDGSRREVIVFTNSLQSTDAIYVAANFYRIIFNVMEKGVTAYVHNAQWNREENPFVPYDYVSSARWGTHSKTIVFDDESFMIGTYNIDNRSDFYNAEMAIFCEPNGEDKKGSDALTKDLLSNMEERIHTVGHKLIDKKRAVDAEGNIHDIYGGAEDSKVRLMNGISLPSWLLEFLM